MTASSPSRSSIQEDKSTFGIHRLDHEETVELLPSPLEIHGGFVKRQPSQLPWYWNLQIWHVAVSMISVFMAASVAFSASNPPSNDLPTINQYHYGDSNHLMPNCQLASQLLADKTNNVRNDWTDYDNKKWRNMDETYRERKRKRAPWLIQYFGHLQAGSKIWEPNCSVGLDLVMTNDVLSKEAGIQGLIFYGSRHKELATSDDAIVNLRDKEKAYICKAQSLDFVLASFKFDAVFLSSIGK